MMIESCVDVISTALLTDGFQVHSSLLSWQSRLTLSIHYTYKQIMEALISLSYTMLCKLDRLYVFTWCTLSSKYIHYYILY